MYIDVQPDADAVAREAAQFVQRCAANAIQERGQFLFALSGGRTPWQMLAVLRTLPLDWSRFHVFQVDERVAPAGDPARNLTHIFQSLADHVPLSKESVHAMPVEHPNAQAACAEYASTLKQVAGDAAVLDLVHLGLGADGHTASLLPGDEALHVTQHDVAMTAPYQGHNRMTLTFPALNRARSIMWLLSGADKAEMLGRMKRGDESIPAGRISTANATVFADRLAASEV